MLKKLLRYNDLVIRNTLIGLIVTMIVFVFIQVLLRYVTRNPLTWTDEASRFTLIWLVFLGSAVAVQKEQHIRVDSFTRLLAKRRRDIVDIVVFVFNLLSLCIVLSEGIRITIAVADQRSSAMNISMAIVYASLPFGTILMIWFSVVNLIEKLRLIWKKGIR